MTLHEQLLHTLESDPLAAHLEALGSQGEGAPVRRMFAAAHVVMAASYADVPHTPDSPGAPVEIEPHVDWNATRAGREYLIGHGMGIAEAMDTAQRFLFGWPVAKRLIEETAQLAPPAGFIAGASADHLDHIGSGEELAEGVVTQVSFISACGGLPILLPMPWLLENHCDEETFVSVYEQILFQVDGPVLIHWMGPTFLASMKGYFPGDSFQRVMAIDREKIAGVKLSLLDEAFECSVRQELLPHGQVVLTGDDLNFPTLLEGESQEILSSRELAGSSLACGNFSHGLLGILDAIARPAALALRALAIGDHERYRAIMDPCAELGSLLFSQPTWGYRAGLAHLAWLAGRQANPMLPNHEESIRDAAFKERLALLAAQAGVFNDREIVARALSRELS